MKTTLIPIGNSRGVRIPKPFIDQCHLTEEIEIEVQNHRIIIQSAHKARSSWDGAFAAMAKNMDDKMLDNPTQTRWDKEEWQWK